MKRVSVRKNMIKGVGHKKKTGKRVSTKYTSDMIALMSVL